MKYSTIVGAVIVIFSMCSVQGLEQERNQNSGEQYLVQQEAQSRALRLEVSGKLNKDSQVKVNTLLARLNRMTFRNSAEEAEAKHLLQMLEKYNLPENIKYQKAEVAKKIAEAHEGKPQGSKEIVLSKILSGGQQQQVEKEQPQGQVQEKPEGKQEGVQQQGSSLSDEDLKKRFEETFKRLLSEDCWEDGELPMSDCIAQMIPLAHEMKQRNIKYKNEEVADAVANDMYSVARLRLGEDKIAKQNYYGLINNIKIQIRWKKQPKLENYPVAEDNSDVDGLYHFLRLLNIYWDNNQFGAEPKQVAISSIRRIKIAPNPLLSEDQMKGMINYFIDKFIYTKGQTLDKKGREVVESLRQELMKATGFVAIVHPVKTKSQKW